MHYNETVAATHEEVLERVSQFSRWVIVGNDFFSQLQDYTRTIKNLCIVKKSVLFKAQS